MSQFSNRIRTSTVRPALKLPVSRLSPSVVVANTVLPTSLRSVKPKIGSASVSPKRTSMHAQHRSPRPSAAIRSPASFSNHASRIDTGPVASPAAAAGAWTVVPKLSWL